MLRKAWNLITGQEDQQVTQQVDNTAQVSAPNIVEPKSESPEAALIAQFSEYPYVTHFDGWTEQLTKILAFQNRLDGWKSKGIYRTVAELDRATNVWQLRQGQYDQTYSIEDAQSESITYEEYMGIVSSNQNSEA